MKLANIKREWWKEGVVYQIYPRSFQDSNGDGIGDLRGIINRLDYIKSLGVDIIWLNPIYGSPNDDYGYDISDYRSIMSEFGDMEDFEALLTGMHERGLKVVMDLVVNHCSDEHMWFQEAKQSRENPYYDYFHWWPAEKGTPPHRWSYFDPEANAWCYNEATDSYYLHYFSIKQPDLNWENPKLRAEIYDMMHFWFKKGIDGFRMDVITFISKHEGYPEFPPEFHGQAMIDMYAQGPKLHEYLHEMNREVLQHYDIMTVAEGPGTHTDNVLKLVGEDRQELNMNYHFDHVSIGVGDRFIINDDFQNLVKFKQVMSEWDAALATEGWNTVYFGNHDFPRMVTRWASDAPEHRRTASKMLSTYLLTMRGTPYYYMGDELGMSNIKFDNIEDYKDIMTINWYHLTKAEGGDLNEFLESHKLCARDNARTPVQWNDSEHAGFTTGSPWIKVNPNYVDVNAAVQEGDPDSELNYFRQLNQVRKDNLTLIYGAYTLLLAEHTEIYAYTRSLDEDVILVLLNYSDKTVTINQADLAGVNVSSGTILLNNVESLDVTEKTITLAPYQAVLIR
jgi:oligo-1,6-glucosidase